MRGFSLWLAAACMLCAACARPPVGPDQQGTPKLRALPSFPQLTGAAPAPLVVREASASDFVLTGSQAAEQSVQGDSYNPALTPTALVITPEQGSTETGAPASKTAWAIYRFDGMLTERPLRLTTDVAAAGATDGGPPVALSYFLGVADQSLHRWEWHGPYSADTTIELNGPALRQRMVDDGGSFFACIVADSRRVAATPSNPAGQVAVQLGSITVRGSVSTLPTKPLFLEPAAIRVGASIHKPSARSASALQPSQFPVVEWILATEPGEHLASQASQIRIYRQAPDEAEPMLVATRSAVAANFRDPLDLEAGVDSARGGATYRYSIQPINASGGAGIAGAPVITVPILAPQQIQATQNAPGGAGVQITWQPSDGAVSYHVRRGTLADGGDAIEIAEVAAPVVSYSDTAAVPGQLYWYFVWAEGHGDGSAANGMEAGSISEDSAPAQGLRAVVLSLGTSAGGNGTQASPYLLNAGQSYQFLAVDQQGTNRTNLSSYSVEPPSAASFSGTPGLLSGIQPGAGDFTVTATLSYQGFTWTATVYCRAN